MRWIERRRDAVEAWLGPIWLGMLRGVGVVGFLGGVFAGISVFYDLPHPSPAIFRDLSEIGVGLLVAFSVTLAGFGVSGADDRAQHLEWLSVGAGIGIAGLAAIGLAVGLSAYREAGHAGAPGQIGLGLIVATLFMLGLLVALLPWAAFYRQPLRAAEPSDHGDPAL